MRNRDDTGGTDSPHGRGVLRGAFLLCEVLSRFEDGVGLSELARQCGLPKATTYRLAEQLVEVGAVRRYEGRYAIGKLLAALGRPWQPHPGLYRAALDSVRMLAALTATAVSVTVLHEERVQVVTAARGGTQELPLLQAGDDLPIRTAAGQILLAGRCEHEPPAALSGAQWRRIRDSIRHEGALAVDHQDVVPGVFCVAAPIHSRDGSVIASISALSVTGRLAPAESALVPRAAQEIGRTLASTH